MNHRVGVVPTGLWPGPRSGRCRLCGTVGNLSRTHVPAEAGGNDQPTRTSVTRPGEDGLPTLGLGRPRDGGIWGRWFCERCNGLTGVWDEEYLVWQSLIGRQLHAHTHPDHVKALVGTMTADPGAFVRCLWAWAFALDETLLDTIPEVAASVGDGTPVPPPAERRLLIAATPDLGIWVVSQREVVAIASDLVGDGWHRQTTGLWAPGPEIIPALPVVVSAPPFIVVLADADQPTPFPHFDAGEWLTEPAGQRREIAFRLPMVRVSDGALPRPITHHDIFQRPPLGVAG